MTENPNLVLTRSVTRDEYNRVEDSGVIKMMVPFFSFGSQSRLVLPPEPPPYWSLDRDIILRASIHSEAMWAGAVGIAITRMASRAWEVTSAVPRRARRSQELLLQADGRQVRWGGFIAKQLRDFLTTDNGEICEIVRATSALGSRIVGLKHLDSLRCTRTGDPNRPIIYRDKLGRQHVLRDYQVMMLSDMPDPSETYYGIGHCAASRAYLAIYKLASIEWYLREKVAGLHPLAIHIVNGILTNQISAAVEAAKEEQISKGAASYMGAVIIGTPKETPPELVTIPLAELPDRFNRKEEFDIAVLTYANSIGLDPQDLQPLSGQSLGTGAQSQVLEDKQKGKGLAFWSQEFPHMLNDYVLDDMTTFAFIERDYRDQERQAAVQKAHADVSKLRIDAGITTADQERQILVDYDDLPKEFIARDETATESVSDSEKPAQDAMAEEGALAATPPAPAQGEDGKPPADGPQQPPQAQQPPQGDGKPPAAEKPAEKPAAPAAEKPQPAAEKPQPDDEEEEEKKKTAVKEAQGDVEKSVMVALFIPASVASRIAVPEGNPPGDLHITLAYLGEDATETADRDEIERAVAHVASHAGPVDGKINGFGAFEIADGKFAHFLTLDAPSLPALRQALVDALNAAGAAVVENHGFVPHITLTYNDQREHPAVELPRGEVSIPELTVAWGSQRREFPLSAGTRTKAASEHALVEAALLLDKVMAKIQNRKPPEA